MTVIVPAIFHLSNLPPPTLQDHNDKNAFFKVHTQLSYSLVFDSIIIIVCLADYAAEYLAQNCFDPFAFSAPGFPGRNNTV